MIDVPPVGGDLQGRVAVVTGAARGIGRSVTEHLLSRGAKVAALDVDSVALGQLARSTPGDRLYVLRCDVQKRSEVRHALELTVTRFGTPTLLANVAGILQIASATETSEAQLTQCFSVNALGVMLVCQAAVPYMRRAARGAIVTVSSNAATTPRTQFAAYAASKAAATAYTRCLGLELAPHGIRCNIVSPGTTDTELLRSLLTTKDALDAAITGTPDQYRCGIPLGRIADPADVARAVVFLLSDEARHITLHDLRVDGGATLGVG